MCKCLYSTKFIRKNKDNYSKMCKVNNNLEWVGVSKLERSFRCIHIIDLFTDAWSWLWFMTWLSVLWEILLQQTMLVKQRSTEGKRYDGFKFLHLKYFVCVHIKHWKSFSLGGNGAYHRSVRWWLAERDLQLMGGQLMIKTKQLDQVLLFFWFGMTL